MENFHMLYHGWPNRRKHTVLCTPYTGAISTKVIWVIESGLALQETAALEIYGLVLVEKYIGFV